jgi:aryl-alcohol dehydrogenase-like predicted oxidoreductase
LETRRLGATGPEVTRLGLGMAALGRPGYMTLGHAGDFADGRTPEAMERQAHAVLDAAYAGGVRYVDTARSYGRGEEFLRSWLDARGLAPGAVVVASKWGYTYTAGWRADAAQHEVKDHSLAALRRQLPETLALLGPHLALYQIHSATRESGVLEDAAVLDELARLRDRGVLVGLTVSGPAQADTVRRALEIARGGAPVFASVQATWNLLERSCEAALAEAHAAGRAVVVKEPLANGRLTARGDAAGGALGAVCSALGATPDAVALAAALAQPWATVVLSGAATEAQLGSNLAAATLALGPDALAQLAAVREEPGAYWRQRSALAWT